MYRDTCIFFKVHVKRQGGFPTLIPAFILCNVHSDNAQIQNMSIKYLIFGNIKVLAFSAKFRPIRRNVDEMSYSTKCRRLLNAVSPKCRIRQNVVSTKCSITSTYTKHVLVNQNNIKSLHLFSNNRYILPTGYQILNFLKVVILGRVFKIQFHEIMN